MNSTGMYDIENSTYPNASVKTNDISKIFRKHQVQCYNRSCAWNVIEITLSLIIGFFGISGNILILLSFLKHKKMRNLHNYFVFNLSITDLVTLAVIFPLSLVNKYATSWPFGSFICKYILSLGDTVPAVSILTLVLISIERHYAIVWASKRPPSFLHNKYIITVIWLICYLTIGIPLVFTFDVRTYGKRQICSPVWLSYEFMTLYLLWRVFMFYVIPTMIIFLCYLQVHRTLNKSAEFIRQSVAGRSKEKNLKQKRKVVKVFFVIFLAFLVTYFPLNALSVLLLVKNIYRWKYIRELYEFTVLFAVATGAMDPLILYVLSGKYRRCFQSLIPFLKKMTCVDTKKHKRRLIQSKGKMCELTEGEVTTCHNTTEST